MTSNSRTAEATQVAPYLTHVVSHHGRLTLIPPENAGRTRKTSKLNTNKEKKPTRRNGERNARSEDSEEARFNLGAPRSARSVASATSVRRRPARSAGERRSRGREGDGYGEVDITIPDYPPPSFQEATSSSASSPIPTLSITSSTVANASSPIASTNPSPITEPSPTTSVTPSQRLLSVIVEPSTSLPASPNPSKLSLPSLSPSTSASAPSFPPPISIPHPRSQSPLPPTPQSPESDSDSDSQEFVCLPLEPSQRQWEEDRQLGLTLAQRVQRELKRQRAAQADGAPPEKDAQSQPQSPTKAEPSRRQSQELLSLDQARPPARNVRATLKVPHPDWRLTLDEPSLRSMTSAPSLATQFSNKSRSLRSPLRPSSPILAIPRPYHSAGPASSTLSLSLGHLRSFGRSTTSLGVLSAQTGGREGTGSRRLFSRGKGKEKEKSHSDGDIDERDEEALDSWEVINKEPDISIGEPGPSSRVRPRLTLKPHLKASGISTTTYEEKPVERRGVGENDTRVDPFPISAEPSSPETERPSSISPTPTGFYAPSAPFSARAPTPTSTDALSHYPTMRILEQEQQETRQRRGSMRGRPVPPPPPAFVNRQIRRPAPPPPPVRTGSTRATSPYSPTSPTTPSPLSGAPAALSPIVRTKNPIPILTPMPIQMPTKRRRTPPPPPPKDNVAPNVIWAADPYDRALEVPLPPTPSDPSPVRGWAPTLSAEMERETEREGGRRYGYAPGPHPYFNPLNTYKQPPVSAPGDFSVPGPSRVRPSVDYAHVPTVPSRLAVSIPTFSRSRSLSPTSVASSPTTPRGHHYPGRPLPMTPGASSPIAAVGHSVQPSMSQNQSQYHDDQTHNYIHDDRHVPEALLIDFDTDLEANDSLIVGADVDLASAAVENGGDLLSLAPAEDEQRSVFESTGSSNTSSAASPVITPPEFSEYTDLDVLLSRLEGQNHNGADYDTLLQVQEFIGPATRNQNPSPTSPSALLGKIEIERRRVLKDGRVKLKLSLLGAAVDKCGICISQFKDGELAALGVGCRHAFHEKCLRNWLARSRTCPLCRVPLDIGGVQAMQ